MTLTVVIANKETDYQNALSVRRTVFVKEQNVPPELEIDAYEKDATHFVAYDDTHTPVGAGRLRVKGTLGKVERICVLQNRRGEQIGNALMIKLEKEAARMGLSGLLLNAQIHAQGFYEKLGYNVTSDLFYEAGIPHVEMQKPIINQAELKPSH